MSNYVYDNAAMKKMNIWIALVYDDGGVHVKPAVIRQGSACVRFEAAPVGTIVDIRLIGRDYPMDQSLKPLWPGSNIEVERREPLSVQW